MLFFLSATQKGFAALCHFTSCWTEVNAVIFDSWIKLKHITYAGGGDADSSMSSACPSLVLMAPVNAAA